MFGKANLTNEQYHKAPGISSSGLVKFIQYSPAHYQSYIKEPREQTDAMFLGSAIHMAILEPNLFETTYVCKPQDMSFATKEGKEWKLRNGDKTILSWDNFNTCMRIRDKFQSTSLKKYISGGEAESSYFWEDEKTGLICKCRPDYLSGNTIFDIKTTEDCRPKHFQYQLRKYRYDIQSAFYVRGMEKVLGSKINFIHIVVEKTAPFEVSVYQLDEASIERASLDVQNAMFQMKECFEKDEWPGYSYDVKPVSLPSDMFFIE
jgi:exodeoxyribonuclease VIII